MEQTIEQLLTRAVMRLDETVNVLERIANALEEQNKTSPLTWNRYPMAGVPLNCYGKDELPLPTANSDVIRASYKGDVLSTASSDLTNELYG